MKFTAVWDTARGAIEPAEELDAAGQAAAFWRLREDRAQDVRVGFERAMQDARVEWNPGFGLADQRASKPTSRRKPAAGERMTPVLEAARRPERWAAFAGKAGA